MPEGKRQSYQVSVGDAGAKFKDLPIGSVLSKAACSNVPNLEEGLWKTNADTE